MKKVRIIVKNPECEDCGELSGVDFTRRRTCQHCGKKVCPYCYHHIHAFAAMVRARALGQEPTK